MFGTIRKHQSWLWGIIITAMILGLVIYFTPTGSGRSGASSGSVNFGSIDGVQISRDDYMSAQREASLVYLVNYGAWPENNPQATNFDPQREAYQWLFFRQKLKEHNIHVDDDSVARMANNILEKFGRGRALPLDTFLTQVLAPRATAADFEQYLRDYLGLQQLITAVSASADLITESEVKPLYIRENQEVATKALFFSGTNYMSSVPTPTPEVLGEFYTNQMAAYRLPERVQVSYVAFEATNYMAQAEREKTNLTQDVETTLAQIGTNYTQLAKTPEEAKVKLRELILERDAMMHAQQQADQFANTLFSIDPVRAENLALLAQSNKLPVKVTAPFDEQSGPTEFDAGANFARDAFRLTADEPFAGPVPGQKAIYVVALKQRLPSEVPPMAGMHDRVLADYKQYQAAINARRAGAAFEQNLTNSLAQGKTFSNVVSNANLKALDVPPISLKTRELPELEGRVELNQYQRVAFDTEPGKISGFVPTTEGGFIVYVEKLLPIDESKMAQELPEFLRAVRQARRSDAINHWLQTEEQRSLRDTLLQQARPATSGGRGQS